MEALPSVSSVPSGLLLYLSGLQLSLPRSQGVGVDGGLSHLNKDQSPLWSLMSIQRLRPNPTENPAQEIGGIPGGSEETSRDRALRTRAQRTSQPPAGSRLLEAKVLKAAELSPFPVVQLCGGM